MSLDIFSDLSKCFVVAEAGSNHNGDINLAKKLIDAAKKSGADAVKFQAFKTENLVTKNAQKARYQEANSCGDTQFEMLKKLELSSAEHKQIIEYAKKIELPLFYSVFDEQSADMIESLGIDIFKLGAGELTNLPLLKQMALKNKPLIFSTGMASDDEISDAVDIFNKNSKSKLMLLHCSTGYPSRLEDSHLMRFKYLENKFSLSCGVSDHTQGILVSVLAALMGTCYIEKHFTLDVTLPGSDHAMSMNPIQMKRLCDLIKKINPDSCAITQMPEMLSVLGIKTSKQEVELILGNKTRELSAVEKSQIIWARKSIVAEKTIEAGQVLKEEDIVIKRPQKGILPKDRDMVLGKKAKLSIEAGTPINWDMLS